MKVLTLTVVVFIAILSVASPAWARNTTHMLPIHAALQSKGAKEKLNPSIKFFFAQQPARVVKKLGNGVTNRKTNAFGKSDVEACNWAFLSAMLALQERAQTLGANAVANIVSYYDKRPMSSTTQFECHSGAVIAGVALKGDFVKIAR